MLASIFFGELMLRAPKYVLGKRRLLGQQPTLFPDKYREMLKAGKQIPQGALIKPRERRVSKRTPQELGIKFHADGSVEIPRYAGTETALKIDGFLRAKNQADAIRLAHHQIESVKSRSAQAQIIFDEVARLHYDLLHNWQGFSEPQRTAFRQYFLGIVEKLAKNPALLREEQKIHAVGRFATATRLLREGNVSASAATMGGIKNNMRNWTRKMQLQLPRLERRRALVVDRKFAVDTHIFVGAVDPMLAVFRRLGTAKPSDAQQIAARISSASKSLFATGLQAFKQPAIILKAASELAKKGDFTKARQYIRDANKKTLLAASPVSSIWPDKLAEISKSTDAGFKQAVLTNQLVLFHDMMPLWWQTRSTEKKQLILRTIAGLSALAQSTGNAEIAAQISASRSALGQEKLAAFADSFARAAIALKPELAKELGL